MEAFKQATIERILHNRNELWFFDTSDGWLIVDLNRKRSLGSAVDVFVASTLTRREWPLEEALRRAEEADWRAVLAAHPQHEADFLDCYIRWRGHRKVFEEALRKEQEATKSALKELFTSFDTFTISDRHRIQLQLRGFKYKGVRDPEQTAQIRGRRVTRCWNCHRFLDNYQHFECLGCGWILCRCGACGCPNLQTFSLCPMCGARYRQLESRGCNPYCSWECKSTALEAYGEYLRSPQWQQRRQARLLLDNHTCQDCGERATDVHHRTYSNIGREEPDDLVSLCGTCHAIRHGALDDNSYVEQLVNLFSRA